ncbi:MAG: hypothetical protein R3266_07010 [Gemmatimonadota bacterium]|nr:hypothetical protein [Gemmatimonadota bacterium]
MMKRTRASWSASLPIAGILALGLPAGADYERIGPDAEPLRSAFEEDAGKVRLVMLVAPT